MRNILISILMLLLMVASVGIHAQDTEQIIYYIASDEDDIQQVYQQLLDTKSEPRQITTMTADVITFSVAPDELGITYISDGQLWTQSVHTNEPQFVTQLEATQFNSPPLYSPDGNSIAYADNGVWLLELTSGEKRQLLADVPLAEMASNAGEYRTYQPQRFITNADGEANYLVVDIGVWEWKTTGIYDLTTDEYIILEGQHHTDLLVLDDGRVLIYGNNGVGGESSLRLAESIQEINVSSRILSFAAATDATLFAQQAIEIEPNIVRVFGTAVNEQSNASTILYFYLDIDLVSGAANPIKFIPIKSEGNTSLPTLTILSPGGQQLAIYRDVSFIESGGIRGVFELLSLTDLQTVNKNIPHIIGQINW